MRQRHLLPLMFLIISPLVFSFQVLNPSGGFRKELLYFCLLALLVFSVTYCQPQRVRHIFFGILGVFPLVILSHEMNAVFLPYLVMAYLLASGSINRRDMMLTCALLSLSVLAFATTSAYSLASPDSVREICASMGGSARPACGETIGAAHALTLSLPETLERTLSRVQVPGTLLPAIGLAQQPAGGQNCHQEK